MDTTILCALISGAVTLIVAMGTWHTTFRKSQEDTREILKSDIEDLKDDVSSINATIQNQISIIDVKIETLSQRVEKHNNVIERTYKLEQAVEDLKRA